jgi:hypothetical protein
MPRADPAGSECQKHKRRPSNDAKALLTE